MTQPVFAAIGPAAACVFGNLVTAAGISGCILIAKQAEASRASYIGYVIFLYAINPFTVLSNLSTGPMLDRLSPHDKRGFIQGLNVTVMNIARSVSPFVLGSYADAVGTVWCMWTCVFISIFAALVNVPLMFAPALSKPKHRDSTDGGGDYKALGTEDSEKIKQVMKGEWVPSKVLTEINMHRYNSGLPFLLPPVHSYDEDKYRLCTLYKHAKEDFEYQHMQQYYYLSLQDTPERKKEVVDQLHQSVPSKEVQKERAEAMGKWFAAYMHESGYFLDGGKILLLKQMILHAFPAINRDGELTEENIEKTTLRFAAVTNNYFLKATPTKAEQGFRNSVVM